MSLVVKRLPHHRQVSIDGYVITFYRMSIGNRHAGCKQSRSAGGTSALTNPRSKFKLNSSDAAVFKLVDV